MLYLKKMDKKCQGGGYVGFASLCRITGQFSERQELAYNILYQEAIKCAEEGMASDQIFKLALNTLREARVKIVGAKRNAMKSMSQN